MLYIEFIFLVHSVSCQVHSAARLHKNLYPYIKLYFEYECDALLKAGVRVPGDVDVERDVSRRPPDPGPPLCRVVCP